jgi:hypothetical protein
MLAFLLLQLLPGKYGGYADIEFAENHYHSICIFYRIYRIKIAGSSPNDLATA